MCFWYKLAIINTCDFTYYSTGPCGATSGCSILAIGACSALVSHGSNTSQWTCKATIQRWCHQDSRPKICQVEVCTKRCKKILIPWFSPTYPPSEEGLWSLSETQAIPLPAPIHRNICKWHSHNLISTGRTSDRFCYHWPELFWHWPLTGPPWLMCVSRVWWWETPQPGPVWSAIWSHPQHFFYFY